MKVLVLGKGVANDGVVLLLNEEKIEYDYLNLDEVVSFEYDLVVKAPGIPYSNPVIEGFLEQKTRVITDIELAMMLRKNFYICVTGSNGKTTTVSLLQHILSAKYKAIACGNIGYSVCRAVVEQKDADIFIVELSSFQLKNSKIDPNISILLNIHPCHQDYHDDFKDYALSKANICTGQSANHICIYHMDDPVLRSITKDSQAKFVTFSKSSYLAKCYIKSNTIYFQNKKILNLEKHLEERPFFIEDLLASIAASMQITGITPKIIKKQLESFEEVEYRLTKLNDFIYNDAKSTNPYSTIAALECFSSVLLICGGYDRKEDLFCLKNSLHKIKRVYAYGQSKQKIKDYMEKNQVECQIYECLDDAVLHAYNDHKDETILFSPMFASFDFFKNYMERGAYFNKIVANLLK